VLNNVSEPGSTPSTDMKPTLPDPTDGVHRNTDTFTL